MRTFDKTIEMKIFGGNPNGRIMCELSNWNGRVYKISRSELKAFSERADAENTGIYFLFGKDEQNYDTVYIGEAEKIYSRLKQHINGKEYWNDCIAVITTGNVLNKAHVKYLEYKFYSMAKDIGRAVVTNANIPTCSSVSEYDEAMLEEFIENTKLLVNTLGYKVFASVDDIKSENEKEETKVFYIENSRGTDAKGIVVTDGFVVLKGSVVSKNTVPSFPKSMEKQLDHLISNGIIIDGIFAKDHYFSSPSTAATIVAGRSSNGLTDWKDNKGVPLKTYEQAKIK